MLRMHHIGSNSGESYFITLHIIKNKLYSYQIFFFSVFLFFRRAKAVNYVTGEHKIYFQEQLLWER